ncbi:MAG: MucB/RseB C-terminal domain-containing protein [Rudaea sp.]
MSSSPKAALLARAIWIVAAAWAGIAHAQQAAQDDAVHWLGKIYQATQNLSYTGTFVYQQGGHSETSRIVRRAGPDGNIEKLEALDGAPREILRTEDEVKCYLPGRRTVKIDRRGDRRRAFPALLPAQIGELEENYTISKGEIIRVAGYECQAILLKPKDNLRYGYKLWADVASGMLLKAVTLDEDGKALEQFTFTQLAIGPVALSEVRPPQTLSGWRIEDTDVMPVDLNTTGWRVSPDLPGFKKIVEVKRKIHESRQVDQVVYSDGLAAVSVFIELSPADGKRQRMGLSSLGAINIYTRKVADHVVTVVGETPATSVRRVADSVQFHPTH